MSPLLLLFFGLLIAPFVPAFVEFLKRKDRGPRDIPEQTIFEEKPDFSVPVVERVRAKARVEVPGEVLRIVGDASIPDGVNINSHLVVHGCLRLGKRCHIQGSLKATGSVEIGEYSVIDGHILSESKIRIGRNSVVKGIVDSPKEVIIEQDVTVEGIPAKGKVRLEPGVKIEGKISSVDEISAYGPSLSGPQIPSETETDKSEKIVSGVSRGQPGIEPEAKEQITLPARKSEQETMEEILESLIASKIREELKKKIKDVEQ